MRLGEILFKLGFISAEELERALRAQVVHGGRIGTNLVEMGFVGLDEVAHGLSQQHRVSAALQNHFEHIDKAIVDLIPGHLAVKHAAIPLGMPRGSSRELAVAFVDPLDIAATDEIAFAVGMRIRPAVAPELRITYYLERFYGFQRDRRHQRAPSAAGHGTIPGLGVERRRYIDFNPEPETGPPPQIVMAIEVDEPIVALTEHAQQEYDAERRGREAEQRRRLGQKATLRQHQREQPTGPAPPRASDTLPRGSAASGASGPSAAIQPPVRDMDRPGSPPAQASPEAASFAHELSSFDLSAEVAPEAAQVPVAEPAGIVLPAILEADADADGKSTLRGRARAPRRAPTPPPVATPEPEHRPLTLAEATAAIGRAEHRDAIGDAIVDYLRGEAGCGLVLICREGLALGWKGFGPEVAQAMVESIAFPLMVPSMLAHAFDSKSVYQGAPPGDGATIQRRLWKLLRAGEPDQVVVAPVVLKERVINLVYCHPPEGGSLPLTMAADLTTLCALASSAFMRIITAAKNKT